ncbi:hypothetical protein [Streptomyces sp. NPDC055140]
MLQFNVVNVRKIASRARKHLESEQRGPGLGGSSRAILGFPSPGGEHAG